MSGFRSGFEVLILVEREPQQVAILLAGFWGETMVLAILTTK